MSIPTTTDLAAGPRRHALAILAEHADYMAREKRTRLHVIHLCRTYGVTFEEIGAALGYTEGAIRNMLVRAGGT